MKTEQMKIDGFASLLYKITKIKVLLSTPVALASLG
ncbi:hypothetical protein HDE69_003253 [Pedobacter cryoconitis]|uniref:Uncharacterized protein n=1 Tax=Pedobacter cryoconitis TaxID=188932 RepID=A0A7W8YUU6_9SPHI|nr:hypothetical protein [Pedobacter cryoconitis]MBB5646963.1 hypothetical protein [Pedobacter cryoconitis]